MGDRAPEQEPRKSEVVLTIAWSTLFKIALACLLAYLVFLLRRFELLLFLSLILAIAFRPWMRWIEKHRWPKWIGIFGTALILFGLTGLLIGFLIPTIGNEGVGFVKKLPEFKEEILQKLPTGPTRRIIDQFLAGPAFSDPEPIVKQLLSWGNVALTHTAEFFVVLILALYFVIDGERVYKWLVAFLPERQRGKIAEAADEATSVVGRYVVGNLITSAMAAGYAFAVLRILHVPDAALLAVLAGVLDLLPMIGFFLFMFPAALLALTVSPMTAALLILLYTIYHLAENYIIVPKVYGNRLRLSTLTVLVACLASGLVAGVVGVLIVLPLVACYPIIENVWLRPYVGGNTVSEHERAETKK